MRIACFIDSPPYGTMPMPNRSSKRPRDVNQLAKLVTDLATGQAEPEKPDEGKDPAAVALGRRGGLKGGKARAQKLSPARRAAIARKAATPRCTQ
jgi:hypothetical protein